MNKDTVILYGTNTLTRHLINWDRDDCEYWAWNEVGSLKDDRPGYWAKRLDLLIQIHASPIWRNHHNINHGRQQLEGTSNSHYDWLQRPHEYPIMMQEHYDDVPSSVKYPLDEIIQELLPNLWRDIHNADVPLAERNLKKVSNFTSSCAYALALAIYMGKKRIELVGIEMTSDTEYVRQRPGVYFWIGLALGKGIEVILHSPLLMNDKPYGYTGEVMIQRQEFEMSTRKLEGIVQDAQQQSFEAKGRTQALLDALLKTTKPEDAQRILESFFRALNDAQMKTFEYGIVAGRQQENKRYMDECDELIRAAGGEKALASLLDVPYPIERENENVEKV